MSESRAAPQEGDAGALLLVAAQSGDLAAVEELLLRLLDVNARYGKGKWHP
jgi:hypothetical protein